MKLRRLMQIAVRDKAYQRAALCVTAKLPGRWTLWVKTGSALVEHKNSASPPKPDICALGRSFLANTKANAGRKCE